MAILSGELSGPVSVNLNGLKFETDLVGGHKTGMYLDQQANYQAVSQFAKGAQVLDCFSFLGGFGLHAARAGAAHVHLLDQSADAIEASKRNAAANGLAEKCSFEAINVFDWLKANTAVKPHERVIPRFDLIILDPPSFTRNRASVPDALRGYKEIHLRALKLLKPGGTLATLLLFASRQRGIVSGLAAVGGVRHAPNFAPRGDLRAIARPSDHSDDSRDGISQRFRV